MNSLYGSFRTRTFTEIWDNADSFLEEYKDSPYYNMFGIEIADQNIKNIYYLLYTQYANSNVAAADENRFKFKLFNIIASEGPIFIRRKDALKQLLSLSDQEISTGQHTQSTHAYNPGENGYYTDPNTGETDTKIFNYANEGSTYTQKRNINTAMVEYL
ncbi:MAG: hypothetical protein HUJ63_03900, partial [Enterococcus sp.]|nr:hypothetical protein [Enterococcus sp.]